MKVSAPDVLSSFTRAAQIEPPSPGKSFGELLDTLQLGIQPSRELNRGKSPELRDLLRYQVAVYRYGMRIELLGKLAESLSASLRRLEQG